MIVKGDSLDLILALDERPSLIVTDPPYAFGGADDEHELSATVAVVLRESAIRLLPGCWMLVMCASSWRSTQYMVDAVRGVVSPVRIATWCKPSAKTKVTTSGWKWASVNVVAFKKGKAEAPQADALDHITAEPIKNGRRAELPPEVARWMVEPFAVPGALMLDPFAGSGVIVAEAEAIGMRGIGFERNPGPTMKVSYFAPQSARLGLFSA